MPGPPVSKAGLKGPESDSAFFSPVASQIVVELASLLVAAFAIVAPRVAHAEALLLVEAETGKVLEAQNATYPWYPASVTKMMTAYVTLKAVKEGRISLDTLLTVSPVAASQSPSKMGFRPGTQVTVDNALKMMLVKSANDMAVVLAEGVGGSIDGFSAQMNAGRAAARHDADELRQSERPAGRRPDHLGARSGDPCPRDHSRSAGIRIFRATFPRSGSAAG